jgi:hypothetical protein
VSTKPSRNKKAIAFESQKSDAPKELAVQASGIGGTVLIEKNPEFLELTNEKVFRNSNSRTRIVVGRDRPSHPYSGYGGKGDTGADSIDIVVGGLSTFIEEVDENGEKLYANPDFTLDAARVFISQKSDVDDYFKLAEGNVGNATARSAVAIKADGIRLVAREGIKIITGVDKKNSQGGKNNKTFGIDLIAGNNDEDLQPMVKGKNLEDALVEIIDNIDNLNGIVDSILMAQINLNEALTNHFHHSPFFALPTTTSPTVQAAGIKCMLDHLSNAKVSLISHKVNLTMLQQTYLRPHGSIYINSRVNRTN